MDAFFGYFGELDAQALGENPDHIPENPAPVLWAMYHQMERWHQLPNFGGLLDQPYILMAELDSLDRVILMRRRQQEAIVLSEQTVATQMQR